MYFIYNDNNKNAKCMYIQPRSWIFIWLLIRRLFEKHDLRLNYNHNNCIKVYTMPYGNR